MRFHDSESVAAAAAAVAPRIGGPVRAAALLGSGWGPLVELLDRPARVPYGEVPGLAGCTAPGHAGELVAGELEGRRCLFFSGRFHLYEGRAADEVAAPVALARALGADRVLLTCATGATREGLDRGSLVLIEDHLNLTGTNPLTGIPPAERRPSFLPMGSAYDAEALELAERLGAGLKPPPPRCVLASLPGPCFETPAEYRMLARLGADVVSMSCVLETIAARYLGMRVLGLSVVANGPAHRGEPGAQESEVLEVVGRAVRGNLPFYRKLLAGFAAL